MHSNQERLSSPGPACIAAPPTQKFGLKFLFHAAAGCLTIFSI